MQLGADAWPWLVAAFLSLALAWWLATCGWNKPVIRALVAFLAARAFFDVANGLSLGSALAPILLPMATMVLPGAAIAFYGAYHREHGDEVGWTRFGWPVSLLLLALFLILPGLWFNGNRFGPLVVVLGLIYLMYAGIALDLGRRAVQEQDLRRRRSLLWLGLGFSFLPSYAATSDLLFIDILKLTPVSDFWLQTAHVASLLAGAALFALFILLARDAIRTEDEEHKVDVAWILAVLVLPTVTVLALWGFIALGLADGGKTVAIEGAWSVIHPVFVALAVARYGAFGLDVRARMGLRVMLLLAFFPTAFGLGWMAGVNSMPDQPTWLVATIFAVALLPFIKLLWGVADTWAGRILGVEAGS